MLTTHLTEVLKEAMPDLLDYAALQKLLKELGPDQKKLADDLIPTVVPATTVQRVLQALLKERVSIRDLPAILEGIGEAAPALHRRRGPGRTRALPPSPSSSASPTAATTAPSPSSP